MVLNLGVFKKNSEFRLKSSVKYVWSPSWYDPQYTCLLGIGSRVIILWVCLWVVLVYMLVRYWFTSDYFVGVPLGGA